MQRLEGVLELADAQLARADPALGAGAPRREPRGDLGVARERRAARPDRRAGRRGPARRRPAPPGRACRSPVEPFDAPALVGAVEQHERRDRVRVQSRRQLEVEVELRDRAQPEPRRLRLGVRALDWLSTRTPAASSAGRTWSQTGQSCLTSARSSATRVAAMCPVQGAGDGVLEAGHAARDLLGRRARDRLRRARRARGRGLARPARPLRRAPRADHHHRARGVDRLARRRRRAGCRSTPVSIDRGAPRRRGRRPRCGGPTSTSWRSSPSAGCATRRTAEQVRIARDSYTYLHLPMVAGIVVFAVGVEDAPVEVDADLAAVPAWRTVRRRRALPASR